MSALLAALLGASSGTDPVLFWTVFGIIIYLAYYMSKEWYLLKHHPEEYVKLKKAEQEERERSKERYWNNVGKGGSWLTKLFFGK